MNNYNLMNARPSIDMSEVSSVKEMIFNRAREKSSSLASEAGDNMTASVQNDVMQGARASFADSRIKPFGILTQNSIASKESEPVEDIVKPIETETPQLKHNIESIDNSNYAASMRDDAMNAARNQYSKKSSLIDSLNFLNTQAAIKMVNGTHSKIK